ncbi:MAG: signal transduction histidine kinase, partial [Myxococcota bacterium]
MTSRIPINEPERIAELSRLYAVDLHAHVALDSLVRLVKTVLGAQMVVVTLVDADRCWFKSRAGVDVDHVLRAMSPCSRVVLNNDVVVVPDMTCESDFSTYEVDGPLGGYAGVPLRGPSGYPFGTLAIMSREPMSFGEVEEQLLRQFAVQAQAHVVGIGTQFQLTQRDAQVEETRRLLSHDFKAPSRQIRGLLELLLNNESEDSTRILDLAIRSATKMQGMVEGVYEYTCAAPGGEVAPVRLDDVLREVWSECEPSNEAQLDANVPDVVLPCRGDALQRVLRPILDNAIRHSGRSDVTVQVTAIRDSGRWHVSVSDNGTGIPPQLCDVAFLMGSRLHRDKDRGGMGVG